MPAANHEPVDVEVLNEIEAISISKSHMKVIDELESGQRSFKIFKSLVFLEYNVRVLAEEYMVKVEKKLIVGNEQIKAIAQRIQDVKS